MARWAPSSNNRGGGSDSRVEAPDWCEDCRRKHGRSLVGLTGDELRRLYDRERRAEEGSGEG